MSTTSSDSRNCSSDSDFTPVYTIESSDDDAAILQTKPKKEVDSGDTDAWSSLLLQIHLPIQTENEI